MNVISPESMPMENRMGRGEKILVLMTTLTASLMVVFACTFLVTEESTNGLSSPPDGTSDPDSQMDEDTALRLGARGARDLEGPPSFPSDREMIEPDLGNNAPDRLRSRGWTITGLVKEASGRPLAGAHVLLGSPMGKGNILEWNTRTGPHVDETIPDGPADGNAPSREREVKSDGEGQFVFRDVSAGSYEISAWTDGYSWSVVTPVKVGGHDSSDAVTLDIILEIEKKIQGIVLDPGGRPVAGAEIKAARDGSEKPHFRGRTRSTSPDGRFVLPQLGFGRYILSARKEGYLPAFASNIQAGSQGVVIFMKPTASVVGTVRTPDAGHPPNGFSVLVCSVITAAGGEVKNPIREWKTFQVKDGRFEIQGLSRGRYVLAARGEGYGDGYSLPFSLKEGDSFGPVEIVLGKGFDVRGVVKDPEGNPLAGARAELMEGSAATKPLLFGIMGMAGRADSRTAPSSLSRTALTDEAGRFSIENATPGLYTLRVTHPEFRDFMLKGVAVDSRDVKLPGGITLEKGGTLEGRVLAKAGEPLRDRWVAVAGLDVDARHYARTDGDGSFRIGRLIPGEYEVSLLDASAPFMRGRPRPLSGPSGSKIKVRVGEGERTEAVLHAQR